MWLYWSGAQGLYQDILAYEHMVDSVSAKAQDLVTRNPTSKVASKVTLIMDRYQTLHKVAKVNMVEQKWQISIHFS